jgi:hypothetical protein
MKTAVFCSFDPLDREEAKKFPYFFRKIISRKKYIAADENRSAAQG